MRTTPITPERIVKRETALVYRGRPLMIELHPGYMTLREKGRRTAVTLDYRTAIEAAYKLLWLERQKEKQKTKKEKKRRR